MYVLFLLQHSQTAKPQALVSSLGLEHPSPPPVLFLFRCDRGLSAPVTWDPCPLSIPPIHAWPEPSPPSWPLQSAPYCTVSVPYSTEFEPASRCKLNCLLLGWDEIDELTQLHVDLLLHHFPLLFLTTSLPLSFFTWINILKPSSFLFFFFFLHCKKRCCVLSLSSLLPLHFNAASSNTLITFTVFSWTNWFGC